MSRSGDRKIKVLHISATSTGGVGLNLLLLARHLDRERYDLTFAIPPDSHFFDSISGESVRTLPIRISRRPFRLENLAGGFQLYSLLRGERFDIVHSHTSVGGFLGRAAAKLAGCRRVLWSIHGWSFNYPYGNQTKRVFFRFIEKLLGRVTDHYVAVCDDMRKIGLKAGIMDAEKVSIIYHGIESKLYAVTEGPRQSLRKENNWGKGDFVIGSVGRFEPQKAMDDFLRAAAITAERHPRARFAIVGDGPLKDDLKALSAELGLSDRVKFLPWTNDVKGVLGCLDAVCMASRWEAMPFLLLEAMAAGRPIVATSVGGVPEVIADGVNGILVCPGDCGGLAEAMGRLVADETLCKAMGENNRAKLIRDFSIAGMVKQYGELYEKLVKEA